MSSLTNKLFKKLSSEHKSVEVNAELLSYFKEFKDLDEYQSLVDSVKDPVSRTENLKKLVFRLYGEHRLKDLEFFKYLVWSGQEDLCKLIGYGHKQIEKMKNQKPPQAMMHNQKPHLNIPGNDKNNEMVPDTGKQTQAIAMMHIEKPQLNIYDKDAEPDAAIVTADSKPYIKMLQRHVIPYVATKWYQLGVELFDKQEEHKLKIIASDHKNDVTRCCYEMFHMWLETHANTTWSQIVEALNSPGVELVQVAAELKKNFTAYADDKMEIDEPIHQNDTNAPMIISSESFHPDDHEVFTDRPIRQNDSPAATTTHETTPTEMSKPVGPTYIIYSKEHSDAVLELSNFLRNNCGISCDIDQYHMLEKISHWGVWKENRIKELAKHNGFVLLVCSSKMYQQLSDPKSSQVEMKAGHIDTLTLNNLITDPATTDCIIPVCLEKLNKEIVPCSLRGRTIYSLSFNTLMRADPNADFESILATPELESLRSLVYILKGEVEISRPPLGGPKH